MKGMIMYSINPYVLRGLGVSVGQRAQRLCLSRSA